MWFCAVRSADLEKPGAFRTVHVGRENVLITRSRTGELRAFLNVCRHRGARLCTEESGEVRRNLQCPYHAWTYDLDGKLIAAPNLIKMHDVDRVEYRLVKVALREWLGYAWVCLTDEPPVFEDTVMHAAVERLGDVAAIEHYGTEHPALGQRITYDVKANRKLIVENFMECCHCATIHPELTEVLPEFADGYAAQDHVRHGAEFRRGGQGVHGRRQRGLRQAARGIREPGPPLLRHHREADGVREPRPRSCDPAPHVPARRGPHGRRVRLAVRAGGGGVRDGRVEVGGAVPPGERAGFEACERTQPAMTSRAYRKGGVLVPNEHHIGIFHEWLVERLGGSHAGPVH
jgi:Rieske 2Fe-2S family protein